jgi:hypothetical protein
MKRWHNIAAVCGFFIVLLFVASRFLQVRTSWSGLSWSDLRDLMRGLMGFGLFILKITAILLAVRWGAYLPWRATRPSKPGDHLPAPHTCANIAHDWLTGLLNRGEIFGVAKS